MKLLSIVRNVLATVLLIAAFIGQDKGTSWLEWRIGQSMHSQWIVVLIVWLLFLGGGMILGLIFYATADPKNRGKGDIYDIAGVWALEHWGYIGYILLVLVTGSIGTPGALKVSQHPHRTQLLLLTPLLYAVWWVYALYPVLSR